MLKILFIAAFITSSYAYTPTILTAGDEFYSVVTGDGHEDGFSYRFQILSHNQTTLNPTLIITNNSADCWESKIELVKQDLAFPSQYHADRNYYYYTFAGTIHTSVEGDTGGCLVTIKKSDELEADILKIIDYRYITDY